MNREHPGHHFFSLRKYSDRPPICGMSDMRTRLLIVLALASLLTPPRLRAEVERAEVSLVPGQSAASYAALCAEFVNAIHVSLLREKQLSYPEAAQLAKDLTIWHAGDQLSEQLLKEGPAVLTRDQQLAILSDPDRLTLLHRRVWMSAPEELAESWTAASRGYGT